MGLFRQQKALDRLEDRLRTLEVKCDDLERAKKSMNLEFTELYDKVSHQMSRMAKRYSRAEKTAATDIEEQTGNSHGDGLDPISRSIMLRRSRGVRAE